MAVGGCVAVILDNTIPGTPEERGLTVWRKMASDKDSPGIQNYAPMSIYDLPFGLNRLSSFKFAKYIPCLPYYPKNTRNDIKNSTLKENLTYKDVEENDVHSNPNTLKSDFELKTHF